MSHKISTRIFASPSKGFPPPESFSEQFQALAIAAGEAAHKRSGPLHYMSGSTRSGWAIDTIKNIFEALNFPALKFLADMEHDYRVMGEFGYERVTVLDQQRQTQVITQLKQLLSALKANPGIVYEAEEFGQLSEGDVEEALAKDYVCGRPAYDTQVKGDEGSSADYLFTYLRSTLTVIQNAGKEGFIAVHVLEE